MSENLKGLGPKITYSVIFGVVAISLSIGITSAEEQPLETTIIDALTPKPVTRSLSESPAQTAKIAEEGSFINSLRNRATDSLSDSERDKLAAMTRDKPKISLEINFDFNSDHISRTATPTVKALGKALTDPTLRGNTFIVAGHTDAKGNASYNQDLSERRADAVRSYLIETYEIPKANLVTVGYGKTRLKNLSNRFGGENRRVEVVNMADKKVADK
jgi:outer membrane protein OmpA-like peptidoglycan-associated protein